MNSKEAIIAAATALIQEKKNPLEEITMREISKRAGVGLGLMNYHFENKEKLIELCVEGIIHGIVEKFHSIAAQTKDCTPFEKLESLGDMTLAFLLEHSAVSRISILSDLQAPRESDNTQRTIQAYLPLIAGCRPDWSAEKLQEMAFCLISTMQLAFLRQDLLRKTQGLNLNDAQQRRAFVTRTLQNIIGSTG